jgi:hypothetical protein
LIFIAVVGVSTVKVHIPSQFALARVDG